MTVAGEPIQTRPAAPARRVAMVAALSVLAVVAGSVLGVVLLDPFASGAATGRGAGYVSADAALYVELRVEPVAEQDAALREFLGRFPVTGLDGDAPLIEQLAEMLAGDAPTEISYAADVAPWFDGTVALAAYDLDSAGTPGAAPEGVALFGVKDHDAAVAATDRLRSHAADDGATFTSSEHDGVTIWSTTDPAGQGGAPTLAYAIAEDQVVVSSDADQVIAALDVRGGDGEALAERSDVRRLLAELPDEWLVLAVIDSTDLADAQGASSPLAALLAGQPTLSALTVVAQADRLVVDQVADAPTGALAPENADRGLAAQVPADALAYVDGGNVGAWLAALVDAIAASVPADPAAEPGMGVNELLGDDPARLVRWIGDGAGMVGWRDGRLYGGLVLIPDDAEEAAERLDDLVGLARLGAFDPESGITVTDETIAGEPVTTIRWSSGAEAPAGALPMLGGDIVVQLNVALERVLIGIGDEFVARVLTLDADESLATTDRFSELVDELGGSENAGVVWVDLATARDAFESAVIDADGLGAFDGYEADIRPWLVPLDRAAVVSRIDGDLLKSRWVLIVE